MNDWISKSLITLFLAVLLIPFAQRLFDGREQCRRAAADCAAGGCGNLRLVQETLDRNTVRFGQTQDVPPPETSR
jgi:hypothetical protein